MGTAELGGAVMSETNVQHRRRKGDPSYSEFTGYVIWENLYETLLAVNRLEQKRRDINKQIKEFHQEQQGVAEEFNEWATFYAEVAFQRNAFNGFALPGSLDAIPCALEPDAIEALAAQLGAGSGVLGRSHAASRWKGTP